MNITDEQYDEYVELKYIKELEEYAYAFWEKLRVEVFNNGISSNILPLYFEKCTIEHMQKHGAAIMSEKKINKDKYICFIKIKINRQIKHDYMEQHIRHELLHYGLFCSNLKDSDYDAVFKVLCDKYNAHFYKELNEIEKNIYDACIFDVLLGLSYIDYFNDIEINKMVSKMILYLGDKAFVSIDKVSNIKEIINLQVSSITHHIISTKKYG